MFLLFYWILHDLYHCFFENVLLVSLLPFFFFFINLLLPKQSIRTEKKLTEKRKYNNGQNANQTFYILCHSLLINFLVQWSKKTKQPKDTSIPYSSIKIPRFAFNKFFGDTGTTRNSSLLCQLSYFALTNIQLHRHDSFFKFILLFLGVTSTQVQLQ